MNTLWDCAECDGKGEVSATPGQPGDGPMPCPRCGGGGVAETLFAEPFEFPPPVPVEEILDEDDYAATAMEDDDE